MGYVIMKRNRNAKETFHERIENERETGEQMMRYKLLVLDIDGTVTNSKKEVTEKTKKAIIELQERGIPVAIASGRPPQGVYKVAETLELNRFGSYILPFNWRREF